MSKITNEPLLTSNDNRFVMFPIENQDIMENATKTSECFWRCEEVDLTKDLTHWETLNENENISLNDI